MTSLALVLCGFVAVEHFGFFFLEAVLWSKPFGQKFFGQTAEMAKATAALAANQGLYNGFLGAGLVWGLWMFCSDPLHAAPVLTFFLGCVIVAGLFGAATAKRSILFVQALPATLALVALLMARAHS